jgi:hypothetical protein
VPWFSLGSLLKLILPCKGMEKKANEQEKWLK